MLEFPPRLAVISFCKLGQLTTMDTNGLPSKLLSVFLDHLSPSTLIKLDTSHLGGITGHYDSLAGILTILHPCVTVLDGTDRSLILL